MGAMLTSSRLAVGHNDRHLIKGGNRVAAGYQAMEGELPYDGTAELWWDSLEEMRDAFDSPEAEAAVADVNEFTAIQDLIVTRETVILDSERRNG